ncbi:hypothetical protein [Roseateles depolymerans]|uniref:hypothetical protein n=1 Tax=Roseateles depolymerans TaxID=76731 RepID=UPI0011C07AC8|nr:hypothetical protein [Roseateles depolymerans]
MTGLERPQKSGYTLRVFAKVATCGTYGTRIERTGAAGKDAVATLNAQEWVLCDRSHRKFADPAVTERFSDDRQRQRRQQACG